MHPTSRRALDGRVRRRLDARAGQPADDADPDRARPRLARPGAGRRAGRRLDDGPRPGSSSRSTTRRSPRSRSPGRRGSAAAPRRRSTTPPTRSASTAFRAGRLRFVDIVADGRARCSGDHDVPSEQDAHRRRRPRRRRVGPHAVRHASSHRRGRMTALLYTLGVLLFVVAILVSIGLHELGHMIPAKKFGGKVTQYFIGFGPTVWSTQRGETEYGVKAIPLGGYVKIVGMLPPGAEELDEDREHPEYDAARQPRRPGPQVQHRHVHPADLRRPRRRVGAHPARGHRPALLQDAVVEEGHRDGRRPDGEHPDRLPDLRGVFATYGNAGDVRIRPPRSTTCRRASSPTTRTAATAPPEDPATPGEAGGPPAGRRDRQFNGTAGHRLGAAADADPRQRRRRGRHRGRARRRAAHRHHQHHRGAAPRRRPPTRPSSEVGFLGVTPTAQPRHRRPDLHRASRWAR